MYGKRLIFIWGSAWVAATMAVNPFLPNEVAFDLFRGLQGLVSLLSTPARPDSQATSPEVVYSDGI
jgi:hypothetical protein